MPKKGKKKGAATKKGGKSKGGDTKSSKSKVLSNEDVKSKEDLKSMEDPREQIKSRSSKSSKRSKTPTPDLKSDSESPGLGKKNKKLKKQSPKIEKIDLKELDRKLEMFADVAGRSKTPLAHTSRDKIVQNIGFEIRKKEFP